MMPKVHSLLLTILFLAGCGQKGPLYLPGNPSQVQQPPQTAPAEVPAEDDEDDEDDDEG